MKNLTKLDISKISRTGKYVDFDNSEIFNLNVEDILFLRKFHNNPNIAADFNFSASLSSIKPQKQTKSHHEEKTHLSKEHLSTKKYHIASNANKYNHGYKTKKQPKIKYGYRVLIGGVVVALGIGIIWKMTPNAANLKDFNSLLPNSGYVVEEQSETSDPSLSISFEGENGANSVNQNLEEIVEIADENAEREIINKYCDIYHVNSDIVYNKIAELTDNFSSEDYLANYHINGVVCKGEEVYASSIEQLLIYTIRCIKQKPEFLNIPTTDLYTNNSYISSDNYSSQISDIAKVMGVDRCLLYAICKTECNFGSELFVNANNPAGLRDNGSWWKFDTKEEGFIETCTEIIKYYHKIDCPLTDISYDTIVKIGAIHAPVSDENEGWVDAVWSIYNSAKDNQQELFGDESPRNVFNNK